MQRSGKRKKLLKSDSYRILFFASRQRTYKYHLRKKDIKNTYLCSNSSALCRSITNAAERLTRSTDDLLKFSVKKWVYQKRKQVRRRFAVWAQRVQIVVWWTIFFSEILIRQWSGWILATHLPAQLFTEQLPCFKTKKIKNHLKKKKSHFYMA